MHLIYQLYSPAMHCYAQTKPSVLQYSHLCHSAALWSFTVKHSQKSNSAICWWHGSNLQQKRMKDHYIQSPTKQLAVQPLNATLDFGASIKTRHLLYKHIGYSKLYTPTKCALQPNRVTRDKDRWNQTPSREARDWLRHFTDALKLNSPQSLLSTNETELSKPHVPVLHSLNIINSS